MSPFVSAALICGSAALSASAGLHSSLTFHFMQIEQVIAGVDGDTSAQAIQLRMRTAGQRFVGQSRIVAYDANGENPILITDFGANVPTGISGSRVLVATEAFGRYTDPSVIPDFIMTNPIPDSYMAAGRITFEDDFGDILWSLAYGGESYTGPTDGSITNDSDGEFGPPFPLGLPTDGVSSLLFDGPASAPSTNNADDYIITAGAATFRNNAAQAFLVTDADGPGLTLGGACPGVVSVSVVGASPGANLAIIFAPNTGLTPIPNTFPCAGTVLSLNTQAQLITTIRADASGNASFNGNASAASCGGRVQILDLTTCAASNLATVPG